MFVILSGALAAVAVWYQLALGRHLWPLVRPLLRALRVPLRGAPLVGAAPPTTIQRQHARVHAW